MTTKDKTIAMLTELLTKVDASARRLAEESISRQERISKLEAERNTVDSRIERWQIAMAKWKKENLLLRQFVEAVADDCADGHSYPWGSVPRGVNEPNSSINITVAQWVLDETHGKQRADKYTCEITLQDVAGAGAESDEEKEETP